VKSIESRNLQPAQIKAGDGHRTRRRRGGPVFGFDSTIGARTSTLVIAALVVAMTLCGCGFKLRGQAALPFESIYIDTGGFSLLGAELRRVIRTGSKTRIAEQPEDAEVTLRIVGERQEKHVLSLSLAGKVREFELRYRLAYRLLDRAANDIVPPGEIELKRDLTYDDTQVLAKESEEALLYEDMKADAVQQMLRRLAVIKLPS
jgi:LPS-assembly lipoprotein